MRLSEESFRKVVLVSRLFLGVQYFLSGLNWWVKILPFPNSHDPISAFIEPGGLGEAMVRTGWMLPTAKATELLTGLALVFDLFAPLMLVISMPVAIITFLMDAFIGNDILGWFAGTVSTDQMMFKIGDMIFLGGTIVLPQGMLMFAFLDHYRGMLVPRATVKRPASGSSGTARALNGGLFILLGIGILLNAIVLIWFAELAAGGKTHLP